MEPTASLSDLANQLSKEFDACLEAVLEDAPAAKDANHNDQVLPDATTVDHVANLKTIVLELQGHITDIRLQALQSNEQLAITESISQLRRDIDLKKSTIDRYAATIERWKAELPVLEESCRSVLRFREDGKDFGDE